MNMATILKRVNGVTLLRLLFLCALLPLSACATHLQHVSIDKQSNQQLKVIGIPKFTINKRIDIRQENPVVAVIGMSAKAIQQVVREKKRIDYEEQNPKLMQLCKNQMRHGMKRRLRKLGYKVKYLNMTYWQAQSAYRNNKPIVAGIDALLNVNIKQFGYYSASPFKPYRPGMVVTADLITTDGRKTVSSNVYNVGFDRDDISLFSFRVNYSTNVYVADKRYFYKNFKALMANARKSSKGLTFISRVAAESVAGDLKKNS